MRLSKAFVIAVVAALALAGCSSGGSSDTKKPTSQSAKAPKADAAASGDAQAAADVLGDYFEALVLGLDPFMEKYADTEDGRPAMKADIDSMFADAIKHVDMSSFKDEKHAYALIVANAAMMLMVVSAGAVDANDPGYDDNLRKNVGVKDLSMVTVTGDTASIPSAAFLPPVQTTEGYVDEFSEVRATLAPKLVRKNGTWLIDGSTIDDSYFAAWGMPLDDFVLK